MCALCRCTLWQPWRRHCATYMASTRTIGAAPDIYGSSCARRRAARGVPRSWRGAARSRLRYSLFWPGGCPGPSGGMRTLCMMCVMLPYIKIRSFPLVMILESLKLCLIDTQSLRGTHAFHFPKIWPFLPNNVKLKRGGATSKHACKRLEGHVTIFVTM